jgi:hypothetical protein
MVLEGSKEVQKEIATELYAVITATSSIRFIYITVVHANLLYNVSP